MVRKKKRIGFAESIGIRLPKFRKEVKKKIVIKKIVIKTKQKSPGEVLRERIKRRRDGKK